MNNDNNIQGINNTNQQPTNQGFNPQGDNMQSSVASEQNTVNQQNSTVSMAQNTNPQYTTIAASQNAVNPQTVPSYTNVDPQPMPGATYQQNPTYVNNANEATNQSSTQEVKVDPMAAVSNLNKEEAMEEALSHTTQYSPFEVPKQEVNQEVKKGSKKGAYIFIVIIFLIMLLFIIFLPQISKLFGW